MTRKPDPIMLKDFDDEDLVATLQLFGTKCFGTTLNTST